VSFKRVLLNLLDSTKAVQQTLLAEMDDAERAAIGSPVQWSARDHIAHLTFWKRDLYQLLSALQHSEVPSDRTDTQLVNSQIFEAWKEQPWELILTEAEQVHTDLLAVVERFAEDDLMRVDYFPAGDGEDSTNPVNQPLWTLILSNGFWHLLEHYTQFYLDRNQISSATRIQQAWAETIMQPEVPAAIRSIGLYTLANFYATTKQEAPAQETLHQALALNPDPLMGSIVLYNLANLYATTMQGTKAREALHQALTLRPELATVFRQDPDMASLLEE